MIVEMRLNGPFIFLIYENKIKKGFQKQSAACLEKYSDKIPHAGCREVHSESVI
jgi:hypothetical protein